MAAGDEVSAGSDRSRLPDHFGLEGDDRSAVEFTIVTVIPIRFAMMVDRLLRCQHD